MYAEVYALTQDNDTPKVKYVDNIEILDYQITRRVYDFDTSRFKGIAKTDVEKGFMFVLRTAQGKYKYGGFMQDIHQRDDGVVVFKGVDFKRMFDTQIYISYGIEQDQADAEDEFKLKNVMEKVIRLVSEYIIDGKVSKYTPNLPELELGTYDDHFVEEDELPLLYNPFAENKLVNAQEFIKSFFAYFQCYYELELDFE